MLSFDERAKICYTCKHFFGVDLVPMQAEIVGSVVLGKSKRIVVSCMTRYGKTFVVAMALLLFALFNENKKIIVVAPTEAQAHILRNYVADFIVGSERFRSFVDLVATGVDRIKREVSRKRITFTNGSVLQVLSAEGTGNRLMGFGADLLVVDESCLINPDVYRSKINRMLGDSEESVLVDIGNPWNRDSVMFLHWVSDDFLKIKVDWKIALEEGRISSFFLEEQRKLLSDNEFKVLYEAEFPMSGEDALFKWDWIQNSFVDGLVPGGSVFYGLDVAEAGNDLSVCTRIVKSDGFYWVSGVDFWRKADTMDTVRLVMELINESVYDKVFVDAIGVGKGVADSLVERGVKVTQVKVGMAPVRERERFLNRKAEFYWKLRNLFEEGKIRLVNFKNRDRLVNELLLLKYELTSSGKIRVLDPVQKSPDFADSLMLGVSDDVGFVFDFA